MKIGNIEIVPDEWNPANGPHKSGFSALLDGKKLNFWAETEDIAFLLALERKYLGINYQFAKFACRMLGIESNWSK